MVLLFHMLTYGRKTIMSKQEKKKKKRSFFFIFFRNVFADSLSTESARNGKDCHSKMVNLIAISQTSKIIKTHTETKGFQSFRNEECAFSASFFSEFRI